MTTLVPAPFALEAQTTYNLHQLVSSINYRLQVSTFGISCPDMGVNSTTKLAKTCPLIAVLGRYFTSKTLIFSPHFKIQPVKLAFLNMAWKGYYVTT